MKDDKMQNGKLCVQLTHTKKRCKWNDMPIHTHYQSTTCLAELSWLMTSNIIKYIKYTISQNTHIAAYDKMHMHTPPKSFPPSMDKTCTNGKK